MSEKSEEVNYKKKFCVTDSRNANWTYVVLKQGNEMKIIQIILLLCIFSKLFAANIIIEGNDGHRKIKSIDNETEKLFLVRESPTIKSIEGLENLTNLKYIQISFSDLSNMSSSTWESMKEIETLKMDFCTLNNFEFLNSLPQLKVFSFTAIARS